MRGADLPRRTEGAALFADISGFTPLTEALVAALGPQRGAEELPIQLNRIYDALVAEVDAQRGSVLTFSGDAITCWYDRSGDGGWVDGEAPTPVQRATATALAMQRTMQPFAALDIPGVGVVSLAVKVAVAAGPAVRFLVGDESIQTVDVLAGEVLQRIARAEHHAERGDVLLDEPAAAALGEPENIAEWRDDHDTGERFAVVRALTASVAADPWPELADDALAVEQVRPWLLPPVGARLFGGMGEFLTELRPAVSMFIRFGGIDYDEDAAAHSHLDGFIRAVQAILHRYESYILQITIGDKGSYLNTAFGAPVAHGDDVVRAVAAALDLRELHWPAVGALQIGVAKGRLRTGAYGGVTRRTYGVLGDEVNLAARLMTSAPPDEVFVDQAIRKDAGNGFVWETMAPLQVKGKARAVRASRLVSAVSPGTSGLRELEYALPMFGRDEELALIVTKLEAAATGRGQVVGITGEAGMGKSRLVAEVVRRARDTGVAVHIGACQSYGLNATYLVWQDIVNGLLRVDPSRPAAEQIESLARELAAIDPALVDRLPLLAPVLNLVIADNDLTASFDAALRKASLEALLVECVRSRSLATPLLLVIEDAQWLDPLSHDLLEAIARVAADLPLTLVVGYRALDTPRLAAPRISTLDHFTEIALTELPPQGVAQLIRSKLQQLYPDDLAVVDDVLVEHLRTRAQGNPFYVEELLNYLKDRGLDPREPGALTRLDLPDSLFSLILGRIDQLSEDQKTALKVASVIGRLFAVGMLSGVYPPFAEAEGLRKDLDVLSELDLTVLDAPEPEIVYLFKHALTQEVAYETLSFATRAMLHDQIGQFIEAHQSDDLGEEVDLLAYHYDHSENVAKRREYLRKAGESAQSAGANTSAVSYFERVLPLVAGAERIDVLLRLGQVRELDGDWAAAEDADRAVLAVAAEIDDPVGTASAKHALGVLDRKRGAYGSATTWLSEAADTYARVGDASGRSRCIADVGEVYRLQGQYGEAGSSYATSLELALTVPDPLLRDVAQAHALKGASVVATWQGEYDAANRLNEESVAIRRRLSDKHGVAVLVNNRGVIARFQNDLEAARRLNDESLTLFREVGDRWAVGQLLNNQACVAADLGDYADARRLLQESLTIRRQLGDRVGLALSLNTLADVVIDEGDHAAAVPLLDESLAINRELGDQTAIAYLIEDYAGVAAAEGRAEQALRLGGFAAGLRTAIRAPLPENEAARVARLLAPARAAAVGDSVAWDEGYALGLTQSLDELLAVGLA